jgi:hypothetical protein
LAERAFDKLFLAIELTIELIDLRGGAVALASLVPSQIRLRLRGH